MRFDQSSALEHAFGVLSQRQDLDSCQVESADRQIRFVAPIETGTALAERVYEGGGLVWSTRYALGARPKT